MTGGTADLFVNGGAGGCAFMSEVRWTALAWQLFLVRAEQSSSAVLLGIGWALCLHAGSGLRCRCGFWC